MKKTKLYLSLIILTALVLSMNCIVLSASQTDSENGSSEETSEETTGNPEGCEHTLDYLDMYVSSEAQRYTGYSVEPAVMIMEYDYSRQLVEGEDYYLEYTNNIDPGLATVTAYGIGDYDGSQSKHFAIVDPGTDGIPANVAVTVMDLPIDSSGNVTSGTGMLKFTFSVPEDVDTIESYGYVDAASGLAGYIFGPDTSCRAGQDVPEEYAWTELGDNTYEYTATFTTLASDGTQEQDVTQDGNIWYINGAMEGDTLTFFATSVVTVGDYTVETDHSKEISIPVTEASIGQTFTADEATSIEDAKVTLSKTEYVYNGTQRKPVPTVTLDGKTLVKDTDYTVSYEDNINAGTPTVTIKGKNDYTGTLETSFTISQKEVTPKMTLAKTSYVYDGKAKKPSVKVKVGNTEMSTSDYTVTYASGRTDVGTYKVTVKMKGNYSGKTSSTFKINPMGTEIASLVKGTGQFTTKWKSQTKKMSKKNVTSYQVQYAEDKAFTTNKKTVTVNGYKTVGKKITGLKSKKTYYARVRTIMDVDGTKYYSNWSTTKGVKTN